MAQIRQFSIKEAIGFAWEITKKNFWFLLAIILVSNGLTWVISFITSNNLEHVSSEGIFLKLLLTLIGWIIGLELSYAKIIIFIKFIDKRRAEVEDLFNYFHGNTLFNYFLVLAIYWLMVGIGLLLFVVPGIYLGIKYSFAAYIFADKGTKVWEAFERSEEMTRGIKWKLLGFSILQFLIILLGALAFGIGLLIAIPVVYLAEVYVYRRLVSHKHLESPKT